MGRDISVVSRNQASLNATIRSIIGTENMERLISMEGRGAKRGGNEEADMKRWALAEEIAAGEEKVTIQSDSPLFPERYFCLTGRWRREFTLRPEDREADMKKKWNGGSLKAWLYLLPAILFLGVFMVYPLIDVFVYSFEEGYNSASQTYYGVGTYNYSYVLHDPYFLQAVKNTFLLVIITVPLSTGLRC